MIESQKCKAQAINTLDLNKGKSAGAKQILEQLLRRHTVDNHNDTVTLFTPTFDIDFFHTYETITQMPQGHI